MDRLSRYPRAAAGAQQALQSTGRDSLQKRNTHCTIVRWATGRRTTQQKITKTHGPRRSYTSFLMIRRELNPPPPPPPPPGINQRTRAAQQLRCPLSQRSLDHPGQISVALARSLCGSWDWKRLVVSRRSAKGSNHPRDNFVLFANVHESRALHKDRSVKDVVTARESRGSPWYYY